MVRGEWTPRVDGMSNFLPVARWVRPTAIAPQRWSVGAAREEPPPAPTPGNDPFAEVDELAELRRRRPDGY